MQRNDLEAPAIELRPVVGEVLSAPETGQVPNLPACQIRCHPFCTFFVADAQEAEAHFAKTSPIGGQGRLGLGMAKIRSGVPPHKPISCSEVF